MSDRTQKRSLRSTLLLAVFGGLLVAAAPAEAVTPLFPTKKIEKVKPVRKKTMGPASHLPLALQATRKNLLAGKRVTYRQLQALADAGDGVGAFKLAERIQQQGDPKLATDALHYYSLAAFDGRGYAVRHMLNILADDQVQLSPSHLASAEAALRNQAKKGNEIAVDGLIKLYSQGRPFGEKRGELEALLASGAGKKNGDTAFRMAVMLLSQPSRTPEQTEQAARYLGIARHKGSVGMKAAASNLLAQLTEPATGTNAEVQQ
ncbi:hypothetical protein ASE36_14340 [Rhizobium sp. Root274]|uniref:hypothetical protein n=1 Tax=unclassified Rhizobium TaxID=2613769 RepID=UPI0007133C90|nr:MULTISPECIES: hypothetical protein [unclassified Rhizobium]KQW29594.1 hypothetical protein ASC71_14360 [Rhizobium sp. Root1240]KRD29786.1 hypothetical protein ASE36_14340 [Rhizobium sp. Root274]